MDEWFMTLSKINLFTKINLFRYDLKLGGKIIYVPIQNAVGENHALYFNVNFFDAADWMWRKKL